VINTRFMQIFLFARRIPSFAVRSHSERHFAIGYQASGFHTSRSARGPRLATGSDTHVGIGPAAASNPSAGGHAAAMRLASTTRANAIR
jgi:hypothetical protein